MITIPVNYNNPTIATMPTKASSLFLNLDPLDDLSDLSHHLRHCIRYHLKEG